MDFGKIINNIIICIRFPFLYPRNRVSGLHHTNWKLHEKSKNLYNKSVSTKWNKEKIEKKIINKYWYYIYHLFNFYYKYIYQIFYCIPIYTELNSMPLGWRKAFGIQMCKEIAKQLRKEHRLYKYRILDIKEKFGELRWYDTASSNEIFDIINKYTKLSQQICIRCGKPAKWLSCGWISPYCDDCKIEGNKYELLYIENNDESQNMCNIRSSR